MKHIAFFLIIFCLTCLSSFSNETTTRGLKLKDEELERVTKTRDLKEVETYSESKRWAIVIGINNYEDKFISDLTKAQNDAKVIADLLQHEGQFDHVFLYTDDSSREDPTYPTLNNLVSRMEFLKDEIKPNDTLLLTFSGHGIADEQNRSYLLTVDSVISQPYKTSLPLYEIESWIESLGVKRNIVVLDACRNVLEKTKGHNTKTLIAEMEAQAKISAVIYATSPGEYSYEHDKEPYGVFTTFFINGLKGAADRNNDILITFNEIRDYVEGGVKAWSMEHNKKQKPYSAIKGEFHGDMVLSVIPLKERAKYNPRLITASYKKQLLLYQVLNYSSISLLGLSVTGAIIGTAIGVYGYNQYYTQLRPDSPTDEFVQYKGMRDAGLWCAIGFGISTAVSLGPFIASFFIRPKTKVNKLQQFSFDVGITNDRLLLAASIKL